MLSSLFLYFSCQVDALRADLYDKIEANDIDSKNRDKGDFLKQDGNRKWLNKSTITFFVGWLIEWKKTSFIMLGHLSFRFIQVDLEL